MSRIRRSSALLLAAVTIAAIFFAASQQTDIAQSGPQAEMALVVNPDGAACTEVCAIPLNGTFTLAVDIVTAPAGGYIAAQTFIDYGDNLIYDINARPAEEEIVWADLEPRTAVKASFGTGLVNHGGLSGLLPPQPVSTYTGTFVEISLTCSADDTSTKIDLLTHGGLGSTNTGTQFAPPDDERIIPIVGSLQVDCGAGGPLDTPTPTAGPLDTPTPRPTSGPLDTPTPRPTSGPQAEMALVVNPDGAACTEVCTIPLGGTFTLAVDIVTAPAGGYVLAQTFIDFGDNLFYDIDARPAEEEIVWADVDPRAVVRAFLGAGLVNHGAITSLIPPQPVSTDNGNFVEIQLTCSAGDTSTKVELLPWGNQQVPNAGAAFALTAGEQIVPIVGSLQVDCGAGGPLDTPTPTATQTPLPTTPTPRPTPSVGDVNCDGAFNSIDAALILRWHAGLRQNLPCSEQSDVNGDGNTDSRDAFLVLQFGAGFLATLPP